jgi:transcriptional regulator with XRE-family HTH domain
MTGKDIRDRITQLRLEKNLSEYDLSLRLGQSKGYIQGITSGRSLPSMQMLLNICEFFDIEVSEFFESTLPSPAARELRRELQDLSDEDLNCLIHIVKRMKGTDT